MLKTLRIRNLVTIEDLRVELGSGLNVLTGETGAGKSILVDALGLACGDRADAGLIRSGADRAVVEAAFELDRGGALTAALEEAGLDAPDGEVVVRREIVAGGAGRVLVNGSPATVAALREVAAHLVELHGQHEHQGLLLAERHLALLDAFGGHEEALRGVANAHAEVRLADERLARIEEIARDGRLRADALREASREIRGVEPRPGELEELGRERAILQNGARVAELLAGAIARLDEDEPSAIAGVLGAQRRVAELARIDPTLEPLAARLAGAGIEIQDVCETLTRYRDAVDVHPARLEAIETRRAALDRLLLKWGPREEDALTTAAESESQLAALDHLGDETAAAHAAVAAAREAYVRAAHILTLARRRAAGRLGPAVEAELRPLALPKATFEIALTPARGPAIGGAGEAVPLHPGGAERAEFLLAANPGEPARPLARAASGGELSRVMLALHLVLDAAGAGRVLVFDEVDAGVSGAVAVAVGARLARLAARHQVLCVTHLPQVAAHADGHYHVAKRVSGGRTRTEIEALAGDARVDELARMLGGRRAGSAARHNAAELLAEAAEAGRGRGRG